MCKCLFIKKIANSVALAKASSPGWPPGTVRGLPRLVSLAFAALVACCASCGYRVSGKYTGLPESARSISIPVFENRSGFANVEKAMTDAVKREFAGRTGLKVLSGPAEGDLLLSVSVSELGVTPVAVVDQYVGASYLVSVSVKVALVERATGKTLFQHPNLAVREEYAVSQNRKADFFSEDAPAVERLSKKLADSLVTTICEAF